MTCQESPLKAAVSLSIDNCSREVYAKTFKMTETQASAPALCSAGSLAPEGNYLLSQAREILPSQD